MADQPPARKRLADLMDQRRLELDLTWQQVAEAGGVSIRALHSARTDSADIRPRTRRGIARGLRWTPESVDRVLEGKEPAPVGEGSPEVPGTGPQPVLPAVRESGPPADASDTTADPASLMFTDETEQRIWRKDLPEAVRAREIARWREVARDLEASGAEPDVVSVAGAIFGQLHKSEAMRLREIAAWMKVRTEIEGGPERHRNSG